MVFRRNVRIVLAAACCLFFAAAAASLLTGPASLTISELRDTLAGHGSRKSALILYEFRLPTLLITILSGAGLALAGALLQGITRNPLTDSGVLSVNAGSGLMVLAAIGIWNIHIANFVYILPVFSFIGGMLAATLVFLLAYRKHIGPDPEKLVLIGVGMAAAISGVILTLSLSIGREQYDFFAAWIAGDVWGNDWPFVLALLPWISILAVLAYRKSQVLDVMSLDDTAAVGLGLRIAREKLMLTLIGVALASASVSAAGSVPFIGLMCPHLARSLVGPRHRRMLPLAAIAGATLLTAAETMARSLAKPAGIPAGLVVSALGAPYFLYLLRKYV